MPKDVIQPRLLYQINFIRFIIRYTRPINPDKPAPTRHFITKTPSNVSQSRYYSSYLSFINESSGIEKIFSDFSNAYSAAFFAYCWEIPTYNAFFAFREEIPRGNSFEVIFKCSKEPHGHRFSYPLILLVDCS